MRSYKTIIRKLNKEGFRAYPVGGCVRDYLLKREVSDIDITTDACPDEIEFVFKDFKTIDIGKRFGTIVVVVNDEPFEVTTFREDGQYENGRRPNNVIFTDSLINDLKRRDFTINAMAFDNGEIIDPFDGQKDLNNGIIRAVGNPFDRIDEDVLRILRAIRFASRYDFEIESTLKEAMKENTHRLQLISVERIREEIFKIIMADEPVKWLKLMESLGILDVILKDLVINEFLDNTEKDLVERMVVLFYKSEPVNMHFSNSFYKDVLDLHKIIDEDINKFNLRKIYRDLGKEQLIRYANIKKAQGYDIFLVDDVLKEGVLELPINGTDLIKLGYRGKEIGDILNEVSIRLMNDTLDKKDVMEYVKNFRRTK